jgi:hypothetical protein
MSETLNGNTDTSSTGGFTNLSQAKYDSNCREQVLCWNAFVASLPPNQQAQAGPPRVVAQVSNTYNLPGTAVEAYNAEVPITKNANGSVSGRIPGTQIVVNLTKSAA